MRLIPSDPNLLSIFQKIEKGLLNLQPDFQRGEVWGEKKKKRLIDTILRKWHIPPIHLIEVKSNNDNFSTIDEVLDGQQRLVAIRDFFRGDFSIDGNIEPLNENLLKLDGLKYEDLSPNWKQIVDFFSIRVFQIVDYSPPEPAELFYRLNQPTNLTPAEQRNAFYGPARLQIKALVTNLEEQEEEEKIKDILGFSNSRMAYDDVLSKFCYALELKTLRKRITAIDISDKYRSGELYSLESISSAAETLKLFIEVSKFFQHKIKFTKATLFSWLCFLVEIRKQGFTKTDKKFMGEFISYVEIMRNRHKYKLQNDMFLWTSEFGEFLEKNVSLISIFNQKASSGSTDVSAILLRDLIIWMFFLGYFNMNKMSLNLDEKLFRLKNHLDSSNNREYYYWTEEDLMFLIETFQWGIKF